MRSGDEQHPGERLEEAEEPPADRGDGRDLHEVRGDVEAGQLEHQRQGHDETAATRRAARSRRAVRGSASKTSKKVSGIRPSARNATSPHRGSPAGPPRRRSRRRGPRGQLVRRQLGPPGPDRLERVPELPLRRRLVQRSVEVRAHERLDRRREPLDRPRLALTSAARGKRTAFRHASASCPIDDDELRLHDVELTRRATRAPAPRRRPRT